MALKFLKRKRARACVIGLDGVPYSLLTHLMESGVMPRCRDIVSRGRILPMTVSLPEISSVSWSSFMTGRNPGEHGIFGFTDLKESSYDLRFPSFRDLRCETIWDLLGKRDMRSVVINQPSTYPARAIPGVLISGFVAIDIDKSIYPRKYLASLARARYRIDIDTDKCRDDTLMLFAELDELLRCRRAIMDELWSKESWNLMQVVVTGTDRLHHFAWDAYEDPDHRYHEEFLRYYRRVDEFIDHAFDRFQGDGSTDNFFLLSDHGFCGTRHEVYVNAALERAGFLSFDSSDGHDLGDISQASRAFALDPARIYLHRRGRYPRGNVEEGDVDSIKKDLVSVFEDLQDESIGGSRVIRRIFDGREVYNGPFADLGPDLLLVPHNGYDLKGWIGAPSVIGERRLQGMHTWDDAFFFSLRRDLLNTGEDLTIFDVPNKILRSLDATS